MPTDQKAFAPVAPKADAPRPQAQEAFKPVEFWNPSRKNLRIVRPGHRHKYIQFINGRYLATTQEEVDLIRRACGSSVYETDLPENAPDLNAGGWISRSSAAHVEELNRLGRG